MVRIDLRLSLVSAVAIIAAVAPNLASAGCSMPVAIANPRFGNPSGGGFDFSSCPVTEAPPIRFWAFGKAAEMNNGTQVQSRKDPNESWFVNPKTSFPGALSAPEVWSLLQANWAGPQVNGCVMDIEVASRRTVVEVSLAHPKHEGTTAHGGYFAIASVDFAASFFDFDRVTGAGGAAGNVVKLAAIPAPKVISAAKVIDGKQDITLELSGASSYSEGGVDKPALVRGYRVLYAVGSEPTSSNPTGFKPAMDKAGKALGTVKAGKVTVTVPAADVPVWLVAQLVYEDPSDLLSNVTSAHVAVSGEASGGRQRKSGARERQ